MKFQFKKKLSAFTDNNILLATTKFGNIIYVDNVLKVESALHTIYEYDFIKNEWTKHHGKLDIVANVTIDAIECDLVVINPLFFDYIELYDTDKEVVMNEYYRWLRSVKCFPIINRGKAWYDRLSSFQEMELNHWYEEWLDITDTYIVPVDLPWINIKLKKLEDEIL